jgi:hypothetical protein
MRKFKTVRSVDSTDFSIKVLYLMKNEGEGWQPVGEVKLDRHDTDEVIAETFEDFNKFLAIKKLAPLSFEEIGYYVTNNSSNGLPPAMNNLGSIDEVLKLSGLDKNVIDSSKPTYKTVVSAMTIIQEAVNNGNVIGIEVEFDNNGQKVYNIKSKKPPVTTTTKENDELSGWEGYAEFRADQMQQNDDNI